ncbi:hypothetical protein FRC02_008064 [Tulasnella sp. 418]|nr:hypothetical protein FRC02_008064 [Tulasnella sp. 418]
MMDVDDLPTNHTPDNPESSVQSPIRTHQYQPSQSQLDSTSTVPPAINESIINMALGKCSCGCTSGSSACKCGNVIPTAKLGVDMLGSLDWTELFPYLQAELPGIFNEPPLLDGHFPPTHTPGTGFPSISFGHPNASLADIRLALQSSGRRNSDAGNLPNTSQQGNSGACCSHSRASSCCSSGPSAPALVPQQSGSSCCQKSDSTTQPSLPSLSIPDVEAAKLVLDYAAFLLQHHQQREKSQATNTEASLMATRPPQPQSASLTHDSGSCQPPASQLLINIIDKYQQQRKSNPNTTIQPISTKSFTPPAPAQSTGCGCGGNRNSGSQQPAPESSFMASIPPARSSHDFRVDNLGLQTPSAISYTSQLANGASDAMDVDLQAPIVAQKSGCCGSKSTASRQNDGFSGIPQVLDTSSLISTRASVTGDMMTTLPGYIPGCTCGCADGRNDGPCDCGCVGICLCGDGSRGFGSSSSTTYPPTMNAGDSAIPNNESSMLLDLSALQPITSSSSAPPLPPLPPEIQSLLPSVVPGCTCGCSSGTNSADCTCGCVGVCRCGMGIDVMKTMVEQELGITGFNAEMLLPYIQGTPTQPNSSTFAGGNALSSQMTTHNMSDMTFQPLQMGSNHPFDISSGLPESSLLNTSIHGSVHSMETQPLLSSASPPSAFFYSPSIESFGTPELHSSIHPHSCCCTTRRSPTAYEIDEATSFSSAISLLNPDPPTKRRRHSKSSLSVISIGPSMSSSKQVSSETRLSGQVAAPVSAYACGHPDCWDEAVDFVESGDEELLTFRAKVTYSTSAELVDHRRTVHGAEEENSPGPGKGTGAGGTWLFRCALKGCGKGWKSINGMQYHLQLSKAHFQLAINAKKRESQDHVPDDLFTLNTARSSNFEGQEEGLSDREPSSAGGRSGNSSVKGNRTYVCPHEGCGNVYKQASGLKYHIMHGHPNTQPLQLQHVPPALARKMGA